jgi:hypothetical protein
VPRLFLLPVLIAGLLPQGAAATAEAGRRPLVAVIDSGVARTPELAPWLAGEYDMASPDAPRAAFAPRYDHGTMVATILVRAARRPVDIVSIRIDDPAGCPEGAPPPCQPSPAPVAAAIRKAISLGVDAVNLSLSMGEHAEIVAAVREAAARNILVVMAAGNEGLDRPANLPMAEAAWPHAVLVGALDGEGRVWGGTNLPGARGRYAYAWQTGVNVPTVMADGQSGWGTGTSFAAPIETAKRLARLRPGTSMARADPAASVRRRPPDAEAVGAQGAATR